MDGQTEKSESKNMNSGEKRSLRETTFREQIETVLAVERELEGRWVIQKFAYGEWRALWVNPISPENPVSEMWYPFGSSMSYATSGEAVEAMIKLKTIAPDAPMRVEKAEQDIRATQLAPATGDDRAQYGQFPKWGELLQMLPELFDDRMHRSSSSDSMP